MNTQNLQLKELDANLLNVEAWSQLEAFGEAICLKIVSRIEHCEALPSTPTCFMSNKRVLGSKVANVIGINVKTLYLALHPVMMPILLLMK